MEEVLFPCLPSHKLAQFSTERTLLGPRPLLPGRTVGAAAPRPQAPGRYLRDHLAAQLTRAPGHRHTWGRKAGRKGTGLCVAGLASGVRGARGPQTSPSGQGHNGAGAQHRLPGREGGGASCHRACIRGSRISNWAGDKSHHKSERRQLLLPAYRHQSRATRNTENQEPWLCQGQHRRPKNWEPTLPKAAEKLQENRKSMSFLVMESNCPEAAQ